MDDWDSYYVERAMAVANGTWESQDSWWGFTKDGMGGEVGMVHLADYDNMPADVMAEAKAIEAALAAGDRHPSHARSTCRTVTWLKTVPTARLTSPTARCLA